MKKENLKKVSLFMASIMLCSVLISSLTITSYAEDIPVMEGAGTTSDPYKITTLSQLQSINSIPDSLSKNYILMNDLDFSSSNYDSDGDNSNGNWTAIGSYGNTFTGTFDGNGHTISGMNIYIQDSDNQGLFGYIEGNSAEIKNVGLIGGSVSGRNSIGAIVGLNNDGAITNCYSTGDVSSTKAGYGYIGGIVGINGSNGKITDCYSKGDITGDLNNVGGIVGGNNGNGEITNCYSTGEISATESGGFCIGGILGSNTTGSVIIINCYSAGSVSGCGGIGGILGGSNASATITNCYSTGAISGTKIGSRAVGGIVGLHKAGLISNCYSTGDILGISDIGGITGVNEGVVTNCYQANWQKINNVLVSGGNIASNIDFINPDWYKTILNWGDNSEWYITGLVDANPSYFPQVNRKGYTTDNSSNILQGQSNIKIPALDITIPVPEIDIQGNNKSIANGSINPLVDYDTDFGSIDISDINGIEKTFTIKNIGTGSLDINGTPKVSITGENASEFDVITLDANIIATLAPNESTNFSVKFKPTSAGIKTATINIQTNDSDENPFTFQLKGSGLTTDGDGTKENPYQINTLTQLQNINKDSVTLSQNYILMRDLDFSDSNNDGIKDDPYDSDKDLNNGNWTALGISNSKPFIGTFDGNGHTITGMNINLPSNMYQGLFGYTGTFVDKDTIIKNIGVIDANIKGKQNIGGIVGWNKNTDILNCYSTGNIVGLETNVGGVVGTNEKGTITNSYSTGAVSGKFTVGGIIGWNVSGTIENSYFGGTLVGNNSTGGIIGKNNTGGVVKSCYSTGNISGDNMTGGIIGVNEGLILSCYSTGSLTGKNSIGGIIGSQSSGTIEDCYSSGDLSGNNGLGGIVGTNFATIRNSYSTRNIAGTDNNIGGLVGDNNSGGNIINSYSTGDVSGKSRVGGFVGSNFEKITNSYSTGKVSADINTSSYIGGFVGFNNAGGTVTNSYSVGDVSGKKLLGGFVGTNIGTITNCYQAEYQKVNEILVSGENLVSNNDFTNPDWYKTTLNWGSNAEWHISGCVDGAFTYFPHINKSKYTTDSSENILPNQPNVKIPVATNNADLEDLKISTGNMSPEFDKNTIIYTATPVSYDTDKITITANMTNDKSTMTINGETVLDGIGKDISLDYGDNPISIIVNSEDKSKIKEYKLTIYKENSPPINNVDLKDLKINVGNISPEFDKNTISYTVSSVAHNIDKITVIATTDSEKSIMSINGEKVLTGISKDVSLKYGKNSIDIIVASGDKTKKYTIAIYRENKPSIPLPDTSKPSPETSPNSSSNFDKSTKNLDAKEVHKEISKELDIMFDDVKPTDWFYSSVMFTVKHNILKGTSDKRFEPNAQMTRAMLVTALYHLEGEPAVNGVNIFRDIQDNTWYMNPVIWAQDNKLISGYENSEFKANEIITREQIAVILYRYAQSKGYNMSASNDINDYKDKDSISDWAKKSMEWAVSNKIISGKNANKLSPHDPATRAEVSSMIMRFMKNLANVK